MIWLAGVDGCPAGWIVVLRELLGGRTIHRCVPCFEAVLQLPEMPVVIAVDIPIGLLDEAVAGGRQCDRRARRLLKAPRASSVFSPPVRPALPCTTFTSASAANRASSEGRIGISKQCFGLFPKLRDVDAHMTPELQVRVREVHPEICFYEMNERKAMSRGKKSRQGRSDREQLLLQAGFIGVGDAMSTYPRSQVAVDDMLDAYAACWTAERIHRGTAVPLSEKPPLDSRGLRMEIVC